MIIGGLKHLLVIAFQNNNFGLRSLGVILLPLLQMLISSESSGKIDDKDILVPVINVFVFEFIHTLLGYHNA